MADEEKSTGRWTDEEHDRYLKGLKTHGTNFKLLEAFIQTRTIGQTRAHHYHYQKGVGRHTLKGVVAVAALAATPSRRKKRKSDATDKADSKKVKGVSPQKPSTDSQSSPCEVSVESDDVVKPTIISNPSLPMRKLSSGDEEESSTVEDIKEDFKPSAMPSAIAAAPTSSSTAKRRFSSGDEEESSTVEDTKEDLKPPAMPSAVPVAPTSASTDKPPIKVNPEVNVETKSTEFATDQAAVDVLELKATEYLGREDVQTGLAGLFGFVIVVVFKKMIL